MLTGGRISVTLNKGQIMSLIFSIILSSSGKLVKIKTKFQGLRLFGLGEDFFLRGGHLGYPCRVNKFSIPQPR